MKTLRNMLLAVIVIACAAHPHHARADSDFPIGAPEEKNHAGLGVGIIPDYLGSKEYKGVPIPMFHYEFGEHRNVDLTGNYLSANIINDNVIQFGPALRYRTGRDDNVEDDVVKRLPKIDDTLEAGATLSGNWILNNDIRNRFTVGMDGLFDTGDTYNGFNGSVYSRYWTPVSERVDIGIAGNIRFGDENFNDTYFGVTPVGSARSGLPVYSAGSGIWAFDITPMAVLHLSETWHIGAGVRYSRLTSDAADSPIVERRGDPNQYLAAIGVIYTW